MDQRRNSHEDNYIKEQDEKKFCISNLTSYFIEINKSNCIYEQKYILLTRTTQNESS